MSISEQVLLIGEPRPLAGVLSVPRQSASTSRILVILNSGMMHHVGTCNLSVRIARNVADLGMTVYRFDFSGIGDSRVRSHPGTHEEREVSEVREVLDALAQQGFSEFWLCGLCSGADSALATAVVDERVQGIVQIDPGCYRTPGWYFHHYLQKVTRSENWIRLFRRIKGEQVWFEGLPEEFLEDLDDQARHEFDRNWLVESYHGLAARGARTLVIMTNGQSDCYNYQGQFQQVFGPFGETLGEYYLPDTRHIISEPGDQILVTELITNCVLPEGNTL